jgi:phosphate uptake regulator
MKRKIVQHGNSSLTVTLPSKWVESYNLHKGDELECDIQDSQIIYSTGKQTNVTKKEINIAEFGTFTKNHLSHLYQLGYDEILLHNVDENTVAQIEERIGECIGFVVIEQKPSFIHIKAIASAMEEEFEILLRKSFMITNDMAKEMLLAFDENNLSKLKEIRKMEKLNNRFTDICIRILNKRGYKKRTMQMYEVIKNIERIADEFKYICDACTPMTPKKVSEQKISAKFVNLYSQTVQFYLLFYELFYKYDAKKEKQFVLLRKKLQEEITIELQKNKVGESLALHHCLNIVQKTHEGSGGYFALTL